MENLTEEKPFKYGTEEAWMCVYLWNCLLYVKEHYPQAYEECAADQFEADYKLIADTCLSNQES